MTAKWKISCIELQNGKGKKYKVTRRIPEISISETRMFRSKKKAQAQLQEWLQ